MKIAYVTSFFPPDRVAGAELATRFMARTMAGLGHEVHVVVTRPAGNRFDRTQQEGYTVHRLPCLDIKGLRLASEIRRALRLLEDLRPDLIHGNCLLPGGYVAARVGTRLSVPSVILCFGYDVSDMSALLGRFHGVPALREAHLLLAATRYAAGKMAEWLPSRPARVFYAGCDEKSFPLLPPRRPAPPYRLLFVGRLIPEKGLDLLLDILARLPAEYSLEIVGLGPLEGWLHAEVARRGLAGRVTLTGPLPNESLSERFANADALILPSRREPFGVVCIEAVCSGVPVLCGKVMGLPEAVSDGRNGLVLEGRDAGQWAEAVKRLVSDTALRERLYAAAREDRHRWAWSTRLAELAGLYRELGVAV